MPQLNATNRRPPVPEPNPADEVPSGLATSLPTGVPVQDRSLREPIRPVDALARTAAGPCAGERRSILEASGSRRGEGVAAEPRPHPGTAGVAGRPGRLT
jgi:hypothetical protein